MLRFISSRRRLYFCSDSEIYAIIDSVLPIRKKLPSLILRASKICIVFLPIFAGLGGSPERPWAYEKLSQNPVFDSGSYYLHDWYCDGQAELSEDRQELPYERQQGMQLRKELRLW